MYYNIQSTGPNSSLRQMRINICYKLKKGKYKNHPLRILINCKKQNNNYYVEYSLTINEQNGEINTALFLGNDYVNRNDAFKSIKKQIKNYQFLINLRNKLK